MFVWDDTPGSRWPRAIFNGLTSASYEEADLIHRYWARWTGLYFKTSDVGHRRVCRVPDINHIRGEVFVDLSHGSMSILRVRWPSVLHLWRVTEEVTFKYRIEELELKQARYPTLQSRIFDRVDLNSVSRTPISVHIYLDIPVQNKKNFTWANMWNVLVGIYGSCIGETLKWLPQRCLDNGSWL